MRHWIYSAVGLTLVALVALAALAGGQATRPATAPAEPPVGRVVRVRVDDARRTEDLNGRLHFCVFENGADDYIYVGMRSGMWMKGSFDLELDGKVIFTGEIPYLLHQGTVLPM